MSPRQQPTSERHENSGHADSGVEPRASLKISTAEIFPASKPDKSSNEFYTREQRWRVEFESSAIGIMMADLGGHYLAASTVFQNMWRYTEAELHEPIKKATK
jgi:hypothetical protein